MINLLEARSQTPLTLGTRLKTLIYQVITMARGLIVSFPDSLDIRNETKDINISSYYNG